MKKIFSFVCAVVSIATVTSCDPEPQVKPDFPIEGSFNLMGSYSAYVHGEGYGWRKGEQIGVFVTSDGWTQGNVQYAPADTSYAELETGTNPYTGETYEEMVRYAVTESEFTAISETPAGFKKGDHVIYAYTPYMESATDFTAIPLPSTSSPVYASEMWRTYSFAYAKTTETISEYSQAIIDLGEFKPVFYPLNVSSIELTEEQIPTFQGKKITQVKIISTDLDIATVEASINLATEEIVGTTSKTIVLTYPGEGIDIKFEAGFPPYFPDAYFIPGVSVYAKINPETDVMTYQEEYETSIKNEETGESETVTRTREYDGLKGSFTVVYTIGGTEYTATTISKTQSLGSTGEYMSFPLTPTLQ